jgi:hypothetical protein
LGNNWCPNEASKPFSDRWRFKKPQFKPPIANGPDDGEGIKSPLLCH